MLNYTLAGSGSGTVTANPESAGAGAGTLGGFTPGTEVILTAVPDEGCAFAGWSGDLSGTQKSARIVMNRDMSVTADFRTGHDNSVE